MWHAILVVFCSYFATALQASAPIPQNVYVHGLESSFDFRLNYTVAVVKAALEVDSEKLGRITIRSTADFDHLLSHRRAVSELEQNKDYIHILGAVASREMDQKLLPIRISILGSIQGERIFLIRPETQDQWKNIESLGSLKKFPIGVDVNALDGPILSQAGLKVVSARYDLFFPMLQGGRFDLLSRGIHEAWDELRMRAFRNIDWETDWRLSYPAPYYLYVNKQQRMLAQRLTHGLERILENGTLDRLFVEHFGPALARSGWIHSRKIEIGNPFLPQDLPLHYSSWKAWQKDAENKLSRWYALAVKRYGMNSTKAYRPRLLLEYQQASRAATRKHSVAPVIMRTAESRNDTHILSAAFALELALTHEVNRDSPHYGRPVQHVMSADLDQQTALDALQGPIPLIDIIATQGSEERRANFQTVNVDAAQGLIGQRILVVRKENRHLFRNVKTVDDLRNFRICVGRDWPDRRVLELARIPTVTRVATSELYTALVRGHCHALSRAIYEVRDEILSRPTEGLAMDPYLLIAYPAYQRFFLAKNSRSLAAAIEAGLDALERAGVLDELIDVIYGDSIRQVRREGRRHLHLQNPQATLGTLQDPNFPPPGRRF